MKLMTNVEVVDARTKGKQEIGLQAWNVIKWQVKIFDNENKKMVILLPHFCAKNKSLFFFPKLSLSPCFIWRCSLTSKK